MGKIPRCNTVPRESKKLIMVPPRVHIAIKLWARGDGISVAQAVEEKVEFLMSYKILKGEQAKYNAILRADFKDKRGVLYSRRIYKYYLCNSFPTHN